MQIFSQRGWIRIVAVSNAAPAKNVEKLKKMALVIKTETNKVDLSELVGKLKKMGINILMVEGVKS